MPEKIGNGIGVPFSGLSPGGPGSSPSLPDGYYYQIELTDPRTANGWTAGSDLHNGSAGDTTGYTSAPGTSIRRIALLVAKAAGMTFTSITQTPGFAWAFADGPYYGSNDLVEWTTIVFNNSSFESPSAGFFQWWPNGCAQSNSSPLGPYKYLAWTLSDSGNPCQIGCADIRIRNASSEVGP